MGFGGGLSRRSIMSSFARAERNSTIHCEGILIFFKIIWCWMMMGEVIYGRRGKVVSCAAGIDDVVCGV